MSPAHSPDRVSHLTWDAVQRRLAAGDAAILPVGAGAKQHGFHMPMGTDQFQAEWFAAWLAERMGALIWPTVTSGYYPAFTAYTGSLSLASPTFNALVRETVADIRRYKPRVVVILDTGLSTNAPIAEAITDFTGEPTVRHIAIYRGARFRETVATVEQQVMGTHADEIETSLMLAIAPEWVDLAKAEASPMISRLSGPLTPHDTASLNYSRSGSYGDPTLASREKGERLLASILEDIIEAAMETSEAKRGLR